MKKIKHIATVGCSHSSDMVGTSWPVFLKEHLNCNHTMAFSMGAGNEMNLEKIKFLVDQNPDLLIVQLTEPSRFTMALTAQDNHIWPRNAKNKTWLTSDHYYNGQIYYTFNAHENADNLKRLLVQHRNQSFQCVDDFIINHVLLSDYNLYYKILHTMSSIAFLAEKKNVPVVFFSWCVDIHELISQHGYAEVFKDLLIIPSYIEQFVKHRKLDPIPHGTFGAGHHGSENQKIIMEEYILPFLIENNLV